MTTDQIRERMEQAMTRDEIETRRDEAAAFFAAALKISTIIETLTTGPLSSYDADIVTRRLADLLTTSDGTDSETGEEITGPGVG